MAMTGINYDDLGNYIYMSENYGKDWKLLTNGNNGIPNGYPTRVVREDPEKEGVLYAGTEFGVFVSFNAVSYTHLTLPTKRIV